jgi:serine/threonine protein kinase
MSSIWGSQFQSNQAAAQTYISRIDTDTSINNVLATVYEHFPQIQLDFLTADKSLGTGSMFHVRREIYNEKNDPPLQYYVAVKYMRVEEEPRKQQQIVRSLLKELRAITHPKLRGHPHIISAFGYGWTDSISGDPRPFLVMEYADFGTLSNVLKATELHRRVTARERHHLALDVACGLQALHQTEVIHGDLKTDNILVCIRTYPLGYSSDEVVLQWVAKIADFGSSLTKQEADEHIFRYTGTLLYNAPEIELSDCGFSNRGSFIEYKSADVYSFGLLLWEVLMVGRFYLDCVGDEHFLIKKRRYGDFLSEQHNKDGNVLLDLALRSIEDVRAEFEDSSSTEIWSRITECLTLCLQKSGPQRGSIAKIYEKLYSGVRSVSLARIATCCLMCILVAKDIPSFIRFRG